MTTTPTTPATVDLRECPFCGEPRAVLDGKSDYCVVRCEHCGAQSARFGFDSEVQEEMDEAEADARQSWNNRRAIDRRGGVDAERPYDLIISDVIGILPLLKSVAVFGEFEGIEYDGRPFDYALASAINTLTEFEELDREYALGQAQGGERG